MIVLALPTGATGDIVAAIQQADVRVPLGAVLLDQAETVRLLPKTDDGRQIPAYAYPEAAAAAVARAARYGAWRAAPRGVVPKLADIRGDDARALVREFLVTGGGWLPPEVTAALLRCYGIPLAELVPVRSEDEAPRPSLAAAGSRWCTRPTRAGSSSACAPRPRSAQPAGGSKNGSAVSSARSWCSR